MRPLLLSIDLDDTFTQDVEARADRLTHVHDTISEMRAHGQMDFATLGVALQEIRRLIQV